MESQFAGQVVTKPLNTGFVISKKMQGNETPQYVDTIGQQSIMNNMYADPATYMNASAQYLNSYYQAANTLRYDNTPQQSANSGVVNSLKRFREEPKSYKAPTTYKDTFKDLSDNTLPKELKELFQPLYCKLCSAQLGSTVNAKLHYNSKNHDKKVRKFLVDHSAKTGEPLHKRACINVEKVKKGAEQFDKKHFYCEVCDLALTGKAHAEGHYMGKNHQKALSGKGPAGKGHYNEEGQFIRTTTAKSDTTGRDGFGQDFIASIASQDKILPDEYEKPTALRCELCQVAVTSLPQMEMHLNGQKHLKKLKNSGSGGDLMSQQSAQAVSSPDILCKNTANLYAAYRTPSGQFYCKSCDVSLNSESQFTSHLQSKKHLKKSSSKD